MKSQTLDDHARGKAACAFICMLVGLAVLATSGDALAVERRKALDDTDRIAGFLKTHFSTFVADNDQGYRFQFAPIRLSDDGKTEYVVYLSGNAWCGSGGCTTLVLEPRGRRFSVMKRITVSQLPIRVLAHRSHGWRDLTVWVQGGGVQPGYEAELPFDGRKYPGNPSAYPARKANSAPPGVTLIDEATEVHVIK